jgi:FKBP-type peptidyl-prolyl cis-trans isomerase
MAARLRIVLAVICALTAGACAKAQPNPRVVAAGRAFLAENAHAPGVTVTASGLQYKVLQSGPATGATPRAEDQVKVNYEGKLLDGEVFDSTYERGAPAVLTVRGLIPGWVEVLQRMRPGDEWLLYVPAKLGYGDKGAGPIPPGSVLVFKLELIDVLPSASSVGRA